MRRILVAVLLLLVLPAPAEAARGWQEEVVGRFPGAAWSTAADLDGDRVPEIVVSSFGKVGGFGPGAGGTLAVYRHGARGWSRHDVFGPSEAIQWPGEPTVTDVDGDGLVDLVEPGGFFICSPCGSLTWWQQKPGMRWVRHDLVAPGAPAFFHRAVVRDLDGDGHRDLLTVGETPASATTLVFPGIAGGFSTTPVPLGHGLGSLPVVEDVDGDGDLDVASAQYFSRDGTFAWLENVGGPGFGVHVRHLMVVGKGGAIQLSRVPGLGWVGSNHSNTTSGPPGTPPSAVVLLRPGADPRLPWSAMPISAGITSRSDTGAGQQQGAPGVFGWGDVDDDGDTDLAVSGDGDPRLFLLRRTGDQYFRTEVVAEKRGQAGGGSVVRMPGRKPALLFSSYDAGIVALYRER